MPGSAYPSPDDLSLEGGRGVNDTNRPGIWMATFTGRKIFPADLRDEDVDILDIAFALCSKTRYNGHCLPYSVGEHCVLVSKLAEQLEPRAWDHISATRAQVAGVGDYRKYLAKWGLLHDVAEYVLPDIPRPIKRILGRQNDIFALDAYITSSIAKYFGLFPEIPPEVVRLDTAVCIVEKEALHGRSSDWEFFGIERPNCVIQGLDFVQASSAFLRRYGELWGANADDLIDQLFALIDSDIDRLRAHIAGAPAGAVRA
jgi:hypothetical protein